MTYYNGPVVSKVHPTTKQTTEATGHLRITNISFSGSNSRLPAPSYSVMCKRAMEIDVRCEYNIIYTCISTAIPAIEWRFRT